MDLPVGYAPESRPDHAELVNIARFFKYDKYFDQNKLSEAKAAYYGLTSFMDSCLGRILKTLKDTGHAFQIHVMRGYTLAFGVVCITNLALQLTGKISAVPPTVGTGVIAVLSFLTWRRLVSRTKEEA